jgi:vancomycin resistance protein VanJ
MLDGAEPPRQPAQSSRAGCLRTVLAPLAVAYLLGVGALLALRGFTFESSAFELASILVPFLLLAAFPLVLIGLLARSQATLAAGSVLGLIFAVMFGGRFLPALPGANAAGPTLRVLTYNLGAERLDPDVAFQVFDGVQADVIGLQELTPATARALSERGDYPYQLVDPYGPTTGLLSRHPILASQLYHSPHGRSFWGAVLDWDGQPVTVFVLHPPSPEIRTRRGLPTGVDMRRTDRYVQDALGVIGASPGPVLVLGDFNSSDQSRTYLRLHQTFSDAFVGAGRGFGFTWPNPLWFTPTVRIDYVFHSDSLWATGAYVGCESSSDHCYLAAELTR